MSKIFGVNAEDNLSGTNRNDRIFGLGGDDVIDGRGGNDGIYGGKRDDSCSAVPAMTSSFATQAIIHSTAGRAAAAPIGVAGPRWSDCKMKRADGSVSFLASTSLSADSSGLLRPTEGSN